MIDEFILPIGDEADRTGKNGIWPKNWFDSNPYLNPYDLTARTRALHTGADLGMPGNKDKGQPVWAISKGLVTFADRAKNKQGKPSSFGNMVVIEHTLVDGNHVYSRYAHLLDILVQPGEEIKILGTQIGNIGKTGTEVAGFPEHLHFDISESDMLLQHPTHWPGMNRLELIANYSDPKLFLSDKIFVDRKVKYIVSTNLRVREQPSTKSKEITIFKKGQIVYTHYRKVYSLDSGRLFRFVQIIEPVEYKDLWIASEYLREIVN